MKKNERSVEALPINPWEGLEHALARKNSTAWMEKIDTHRVRFHPSFQNSASDLKSFSNDINNNTNNDESLLDLKSQDHTLLDTLSFDADLLTFEFNNS